MLAKSLGAQFIILQEVRKKKPEEQLVILFINSFKGSGYDSGRFITLSGDMLSFLVHESVN